MKNLLYAFFLLVSYLTFGQRGDVYEFNFKVKFHPNIPVDSLQIFFANSQSNRISSIHYETNDSNEVILSGSHYCVQGNQTSFPLLIFSHQIDQFNQVTNGKIKTHKLYFLKNESQSYTKSFNEELYFDEYRRVIKINFEWLNDKIVNSVEYMSYNDLLHNSENIPFLHEGIFQIEKK